MKKIISFFTAAVLLMSAILLTGCSGDSKSTEFSRGSVDENVYTSTYANIKFTKPDSWVYSTDEEISDLMNISIDMFTSDDFAKEAAKLQSITDMLVTDPKTYNNISVIYENLKLSNNADISTDEYEKKSIQMLKSQFTDDIEIDVAESTDTELGSENYRRISLTTKAYGMEMQQFMYFRKVGDYMCSITVTIIDDTEISEIEAMFSYF